ncbi:MAG: TerC family protein [Alphaproteobacteria bacterium]|nr:TerC family protein [Alphaproteobacteria bacterium]
MDNIDQAGLWSVFVLLVMIMLALDLRMGGGRLHRVSVREAAVWSTIWVALSFIFAAGLWWYLDKTLGRDLANEKALAFITGYLIEKSLAVDNVFVWLMLFSFFAIPLELQRRVLIYGVLGAIAMRTGMIFGGAWLINQFHWLLYLFGAFLVFTGIKMWWLADQKPNLENHPVLKWVQRHLKLTNRLHGERFIVKIPINGRQVTHATPLLLALIFVELSDLIFAVDSIPAIFAITTDPFIVLTSNVFAILGLRAMYFLIADMADRFSLLKYGLSAVLVFIGIKMLLIDIYKVPVGFSLAVVATFIGISIFLSLKKPTR